MEEFWKWLGEDVGRHVFSRKIEDLELFATYELSNPEMADVNLLHTAVMLGVVDGGDGGLIVHVEDERGCAINVEVKLRVRVFRAGLEARSAELGLVR